MPYVSHEYRFIFFAAPATGSTAVIKGFSDRGIGEYYPLEDLVVDGKRVAPRKHATPNQMLESGLMTGELLDYTRILGIRNPFSFHVAKYLRNKTKRLQSINNPNSWINKLPDEERERYTRNITRQSKMTFGQYLHQQFSKLEEPEAVQSNFHTGIDYFLHQESLSSDVEVISTILGIEPPIQIELVNVTNAMPEKQSYHDYYDEDLIQSVMKWNSPSFELFPEYDFEGFNPEKSVSLG